MIYLVFAFALEANFQLGEETRERGTAKERKRWEKCGEAETKSKKEVKYCNIVLPLNNVLQENAPKIPSKSITLR